MTLVFSAFAILLVFGLPIGVVLGVAGTLGIFQLGGMNFLAQGPQRFFAGLNVFPFLAMPLFILAGDIMNRVGITERIVAFALSLLGYIRGGMAHANMFASVIFGGISGAATADAAAFGRTLVPAMVNQGYSRPFACAVTAAGSIIGPQVPPSNLMVIYGSIMGVSIAGLFAAGIIPGILLCLICMALIAAVGRRFGLPKQEGRPRLGHILSTFRSSILALIMPLIILGAILGGVTTPTEAASVAVLYAVIVGRFVYKALTMAELFEMMVRTARITGVIFLIIASASILGWWMTFEAIPQQIADGFLTITQEPWLILAMIMAVLLIIGMFMDINAALIILAPVLAPVMTQLGMDPIHAGVVIVLALSISLMTPPVGACLFVLSSVTGERIERITAALWPFILVQIAVLVLIAYWADLVLLVPRMLGFA